MKHYGRVFGHHAGTDSDDLFIELSHTIKDRFFYKVGFDKERRRNKQGNYSKEIPVSP